MRAELKDLVALVTGGASGIGLATARELQTRGATVAVLDLSVADLPDGILGVVADVGSRDCVDRAVTEVVRVLGRLDIVVNVAGISSRGLVESTDDAEWTRVLNVNVVGMARVVRAALPHLRRSPSPAIVNLSSVSASVGLERLPIYSASKGAVEALTRALASDLVRDGIRVNCVAPGTVATPWVDRMVAATPDPDEARAAAERRQPSGRMVTAEEVAASIVFLASPQSASTTGVVLAVDGGMAAIQLTPRANG